MLPKPPPVQVRCDCAGSAAPAGDHPRTVRHGEGTPRHVLQVYRRVQAPQDHHLQVAQQLTRNGAQLVLTSFHYCYSYFRN